MISFPKPIRRTLALSLPILTFLLLLSACSFSLAEDITPPPGAEIPTLAIAQPTAISGPVYPLVAPDTVKGLAIFTEKCAPCHGDKGLGDGPQAAQLSGPVAAIGDPSLARQNSPAQWFTVVTQGNLQNFMPPFTSLSEQDRWNVIYYVFTLSDTDQAAAQGKDLYQSQCVRCHGQAGLGDGSDAAGLSTPMVKFTNQSVMANKTDSALFDAITNGVSPDMPSYASQLSDNQRWALVAYLRRLSYTSTAQASTTSGTPAATPQASASITATQVISNTGPGTIIVPVTNGSGGSIPSDLPVTLYAFDNMQLAVTRTLTLTGTGSITFKNVDAPSGRAFLAGINYQNTTYSSDVGSIKDPTVPITLPVTIYDTTTDHSGLVVDRMHIFFDFPSPGTIQVAELYIITNSTNKAIIASHDGEAVLSFDLPAGATNLQFQDGTLGQRYLQTSTGFADTYPIRPGSGNYQMLFTFDLPYTSKLTLTQPVNLPVSAVVVLMPDNGVKIKSSQLQSGTSSNVSGTTYIQYTGANLNAGSSLAMQVSGRPGGATITTLGSQTGLFIGLGAFGIALIVAGVWLFRRNRTLRLQGEEEDKADESSQVEEETASEDPETIMDKIIALDDLYQAGEIPEEAYLQRRAELKERLKKVSD